VALAAGGADSMVRLLALTNLATLESRDGDAAKGRELVLGVLPTLTERARGGSGIDRVQLAAALGALGSAELRLGRRAEAERRFADAAQALEAVDAGAYQDLREEIRTGLANARRPQPALRAQ
jgi:hypothetical protein